MLPNFSSAIPTFVVTLREGVEAALVVGIVLAYLKKAEQTQLNSWVGAGVGAGLGASALVGVLFSWIVQALSRSDQTYAPVLKPFLEGVFSLAAIGLLSWMLIWMTQQSKQLKGEIEGAVDATLARSQTAAWSIFGLIFFAVLREGFETVLFIAAKFSQGWLPVAGAIGGLITAVAIGALLFQWGVRINLRLFFQVMGLFLLLIVAGLVVSALKYLDLAAVRYVQIQPEANWLCVLPFTRGDAAVCFLGTQIWDTRQLLPERQFPGILFHTLFGYEDQLFVVQAIAYVVFLLTIGSLYLNSLLGQQPAALSKSSSASPSMINR